RPETRKRVPFKETRPFFAGRERKVFLVAEKARSAGKVILHRVGEHDREPEECTDRRHPDKPRTPANVHKEKADKGHFRKRDGKCYESICACKYPIKIH